MRKQGTARRQITAWAAIRAMACLVLLVLGSATVLANQDGTPVPGDGTPVSADGTPPAGTPVAEPGPPLYPDLVALPPEDLYFSTELLDDGQPHLLLRFATSVANTGEGPLELKGNTEPGSEGEVFQVVYDAATDGLAVEERLLRVDLIYHPEHFHFHLASFAAYELLREESGEGLVPTGEGGKQSSCVLDTLPMDATDGPQQRHYGDCELVRQGISVGWSDLYAASLPDQWVDLGDGPLADGTYVIRYAVDPLRQIVEDGRIDNNVADTRFTVRDGVIVDRPEPPRCATVGDTSGPAGATVALRCSHFPDDAPLVVYWDGWDPWDTDAEGIATFPGNGAEVTTIRFTAPNVPPGSYSIAVVAGDYEAQRYVSATVIHGVVPGGLATPAASPVATPETGHESGQASV